jgi:hypothetical protein
MANRRLLRVGGRSVCLDNRVCAHRVLANEVDRSGAG